MSQEPRPDSFDPEELRILLITIHQARAEALDSQIQIFAKTSGPKKSSQCNRSDPRRALPKKKIRSGKKWVGRIKHPKKEELPDAASVIRPCVQ